MVITQLLVYPDTDTQLPLTNGKPLLEFLSKFLLRVFLLSFIKSQKIWYLLEAAIGIEPMNKAFAVLLSVIASNCT